MYIVRQDVASSTITTFGYSAEHAILEVEFRRGAVYRYFGVPLLHYRALQTADSKGRYFNTDIRGRFGYTRVSWGATQTRSCRQRAPRGT